MSNIHSYDPMRYQLVALRAGLKLYMNTGIRPNRAWTPTAMLRTASNLTNKKFRRGEYQQAIDALTLLLEPVPGLWLHVYSISGSCVYSTPVRSAEQVDIVTGLQNCGATCATVSNTQTLHEGRLGGCFSWGPMAGVYLVTNNEEQPLLASYHATLLWQNTAEGLEPAFVEEV